MPQTTYDHGSGVSTAAFAVIGISGIAVSGLKYVDQILGAVQLQGDSSWLFKGLDIAVCATKQSFEDTGAQGTNELLLTDESYVIVPEANVGQLNSKLVVPSGPLVPSETPPLKIFDAAKQSFQM